MTRLYGVFVLLLVGVVLAGPARAQVPVGDCALGEAQADLDVGNVRARLYNTGHLFWSGHGNTYTVPKEGEADAIFASGIWVGGLADGELRFAGTPYGPFDYWPGPLDENGPPP